jgi:rare lipoprotein A
MHKPFKLFLMIASAGLALNTQADMLPSNLHNNTDTTTLSSRVLDKDIKTLSNNLFNGDGKKLTGLSITEYANNRVIRHESTPAIAADEEPGILDKLNEVASNTVKKFTQSGLASWYGRQFHGRKTASGDVYDMNALTAAHRSLPLNCYIRVTNKSNGKSVVVKVNDRGPFHGNRVLDLSYGAAKALGLTNSGVGNVTIERVSGPNS